MCGVSMCVVNCRCVLIHVNGEGGGGCSLHVTGFVTATIPLMKNQFYIAIYMYLGVGK